MFHSSSSNSSCDLGQICEANGQNLESRYHILYVLSILYFKTCIPCRGIVALCPNQCLQNGRCIEAIGRNIACIKLTQTPLNITRPLCLSTTFRLYIIASDWFLASIYTGIGLCVYVSLAPFTASCVTVRRPVLYSRPFLMFDVSFEL